MKYLLILLIGEAVAMSVVALLHFVTALGGEEFPTLVYPLMAIIMCIVLAIATLGNLFR
jgi:hypothetical protein